MLHIIKKLFSPILIITILSNFIVINEVKWSNFWIWTQENPASSCLEIKEKKSISSKLSLLDKISLNKKYSKILLWYVKLITTFIPKKVMSFL